MTAKIERLSDARIQELSKLLYPHAASKELVTEIYRLHTELKRIAAHAVAIARWEAAAGKAKEIMDKKALHFWEYCSLCERIIVVCGTCGNNCCNGGHGKLRDGTACPDCKSAYEMQDRRFDQAKPSA